MHFKLNQAIIVSTCGTELHLFICLFVSLSDWNIGRIASNPINALRPIQLYCFPSGKLGKFRKRKRFAEMLLVNADGIQEKSVIHI